jgi:hypothetical protein
MKKILTLITLTISVMCANAQSAKTNAGKVSVKFVVDMSTATGFSPTANTVDIAGSFNAWGSPAVKMTRIGTTSSYSIQFDTCTAGSVYKFKFRIDGQWAQDKSEFFGAPGDPTNRTFTVYNQSAKPVVYSAVFNDSTHNKVTGIHAVSNDVKSLETYPNPASHNLNFSYSVINSSDVSFKLYNILGAEVTSSQVVRQAPGFYKETMSVSNLENGLYFYVLTVNGVEQQSGKIQVVK